MSTVEERHCIGCGNTEGMAHLEACGVCGRWFCPDCTFKTMGRRFCTQKCSHQYFYGEMDDDEDDLGADD